MKLEDVCDRIQMLMEVRFKIYCVVILMLALSVSVCSQKTNPTIAGPLKTNRDVSAKVTYIANEGVLIESGGKKVLIDGLHRFYNKAYSFPPDDLRDKLEGAKAPYDDLDLILVSHLHGDHFHPKSVALHLENSKTILATSNQIIDEIKKDSENFEKFENQIKPISHEWKKSSKENFGDVKVKFLGLRHGSERFKWIENLGHLIEVGGKKYLHLGDADMTTENFSSFKLSEEKIDVAFIPYWYLLSKDGRQLVKNQFAPKHIIAVHVSPRDAKSVTKELTSYYPNITVFTKTLETKSF